MQAYDRCYESISLFRTEYAMTFDRPFEIHDDIEVLKRLGMAHGLDCGQVADEDIEKIKDCLPPALRVYVEQIAMAGGTPPPQADASPQSSVDITPPAAAVVTPPSVVATPPIVIAPPAPVAAAPAATVVVTRRALAHPTQHGIGNFSQPIGYARPMFARGGGVANTRTYIARIG